MSAKGNRLYSIFRSKCPRCHKGDFFEDPNPYHLKTLGKHLDHCPVCGQKYELETGFFYGAMILNYGAGVVVFVATWLLFAFVFPSVAIHWRVMTMCLAILVLFPYTFHLTRMIWINLFVRYDKNA